MIQRDKNKESTTVDTIVMLAFVVAFNTLEFFYKTHAYIKRNSKVQRKIDDAISNVRLAENRIAEWYKNNPGRHPSSSSDGRLLLSETILALDALMELRSSAADRRRRTEIQQLFRRPKVNRSKAS